MIINCVANFISSSNDSQELKEEKEVKIPYIYSILSSFVLRKALLRHPDVGRNILSDVRASGA